MLIYEAFHNTLKRYDISGKALARVAGVSESLVSQFRHGKKGVTDEMLDNLLEAMQKIAPGARKHFCSLVAGELVEGAGVENAIKEISAEEIPELLMAIARCWKSVDHPSIYATSALMQIPR
ncbi:helix-turn-helix transcriptional regulator [Microcoleus sp. MOSTC5]|uniref:helix-turn-helix transcriptional regulator n=1 Tax=Microcoleus sp. MOSTC5 TaxID=3055378 RepID=UPI002FD2817B